MKKQIREISNAMENQYPLNKSQIATVEYLLANDNKHDALINMQQIINRNNYISKLIVALAKEIKGK